MRSSNEGEWTKKLNDLYEELDRLRESTTALENDMENAVAEKLKIVTDDDHWDKLGLINDEVAREFKVLQTAIRGCANRDELRALRLQYCRTDFGRRFWLHEEEGHRWEAYETKKLLILVDAAQAFGIEQHEAIDMIDRERGWEALADLIRSWEKHPELAPAKAA